MKRPRLQNLKKIFRNFPGVDAVYLFGSTASGKTHEESDLDLAIVPANEEIREQKEAILTGLAREGFCKVDLIFIDGDDIVLQYEAVRRNLVVYQVPSFDKASTYSRIVRKYLDFYPYLTVQREAYKKRILNAPGGSHS